MLMQREREQVVCYARRMMGRGLTRGTGGNISIRRGDRVAITPSGVEYAEMSAADVVVLALDGTVVQGALRPSSESGMHLACYRTRPDVCAVVHTHSTFATVLACLHRPLPPVHYLIGYAGGTVPCIPYAPFGTEELAQAAAAALVERNAVLLGGHGLLSVGGDVAHAFSVAEETEFVAELYWRTALLGGGALLDDAQMADVLARFGTYGQRQCEGDRRA